MKKRLEDFIEVEPPVIERSLQVKVSEQLHADFKAALARTGKRRGKKVTTQDVLLASIKMFISESPKSGGS